MRHMISPADPGGHTIADLDVPVEQVEAAAWRILAARLPLHDPDRHAIDPDDTAWARLAGGTA